jgi:Ni/Co efflux regulator RcnB
MKVLLIAVAALAILAAPVAAGAKPDNGRGHDRGDQDGPPGLAKKPYGLPPGQAKKMWGRGEQMPSAYRSRRYYIDPVRYHLRNPPRGYRWVLVDDRAYLVRSDTGLIADVVAALLR